MESAYLTSVSKIKVKILSKNNKSDGCQEF